MRSPQRRLCPVRKWKQVIQIQVCCLRDLQVSAMWYGLSTDLWEVPEPCQNYCFYFSHKKKISRRKWQEQNVDFFFNVQCLIQPRSFCPKHAFWLLTILVASCFVLLSSFLISKLFQASVSPILGQALSQFLVPHPNTLPCMFSAWWLLTNWENNPNSWGNEL